MFKILAFASLISVSTFANLLVKTQAGQIIGKKVDSSFEYKNIPYAQAPIGELRWKAPRKLNDSKLIINNPLRNIKCAQLANFFSGDDDSKFGKMTGSEDCLYLNIWRPANIAKDEKLPVFFWLHGGSNRMGFANDELYSGAKLAQLTNSIVVGVNYRLGHLGAFYHEALKTEDLADSSGNFVTLDTISGLDWVKNNISAFNGDADNITIAGQSAGCINVWGLIQSPLAKNKFKRAYCASGFPNNYPLMVAKNVSNSFLIQALIFKKIVDDEKAAKKFVRSMKDSDIRKFLYSLSTKELLNIPFKGFPVQQISDGYVFSKLGLASMLTGQFNQVDIMTGASANEGSYFTQFSFLEVNQREYWQIINGEMSNQAFFDMITSPKFSDFKEGAKSFTKTAVEMMDYISHITQLGKGNIYKYKFEWASENSPWKEVYGATHGIELPFLFSKFDFKENHFLKFLTTDLATKRSLELSRNYINYVKGFIHSGNPDEFKDSEQISWKPWSSLKLTPHMMIFGQDSETSKFIYPNVLIGLDLYTVGQHILTYGLELKPEL